MTSFCDPRSLELHLAATLGLVRKREEHINSADARTHQQAHGGDGDADAARVRRGRGADGKQAVGSRLRAAHQRGHRRPGGVRGKLRQEVRVPSAKGDPSPPIADCNKRNSAPGIFLSMRGRALFWSFPSPLCSPLAATHACVVCSVSPLSRLLDVRCDSWLLHSVWVCQESRECRQKAHPRNPR